MDTIFFNGCIRTLDNSEKVAEAVGIENGRIVFVGTDKEAEAFSCKKRIDLKGRLMLPGFVDTHMHMLHYAFVERSVKLFDCKSVEEMLAAAKKRLEESKGQKLTWLYCRGWNEEHLISRAIRIRMSWMHSQRKSPSLWCVSAGMWLCATAVVWSF